MPVRELSSCCSLLPEEDGCASQAQRNGAPRAAGRHEAVVPQGRGMSTQAPAAVSFYVGPCTRQAKAQMPMYGDICETYSHAARRAAADNGEESGYSTVYRSILTNTNDM